MLWGGDSIATDIITSSWRILLTKSLWIRSRSSRESKQKSANHFVTIVVLSYEEIILRWILLNWNLVDENSKIRITKILNEEFLNETSFYITLYKSLTIMIYISFCISKVNKLFKGLNCNTAIVYVPHSGPVKPALHTQWLSFLQSPLLSLQSTDWLVEHVTWKKRYPY